MKTILSLIEGIITSKVVILFLLMMGLLRLALASLQIRFCFGNATEEELANFIDHLNAPLKFIFTGARGGTIFTMSSPNLQKMLVELKDEGVATALLMIIPNILIAGFFLAFPVFVSTFIFSVFSATFDSPLEQVVRILDQISNTLLVWGFIWLSLRFGRSLTKAKRKSLEG